MTSTITPLDLITVVLALAAFGLSVINFYLTQVKRAHIQIIAGDYLNIGHFEEGHLNITLPLIFINHGGRIGIVTRIALLVENLQDENGYLLEPFFFQKVDDKGNFAQDQPSSPVGVGAKQSLTKQVLFRSSLKHPTDFQMVRQGTYHFKLLGWVEHAYQAHTSVSFTVDISAELASKLQAELNSKSGWTERIPQRTSTPWIARKVDHKEVTSLYFQHVEFRRSAASWLKHLPKTQLQQSAKRCVEEPGPRTGTS
jgi:hypothetical protein